MFVVESPGLPVDIPLHIRSLRATRGANQTFMRLTMVVRLLVPL